jgi:hypothetical protein
MQTLQGITYVKETIKGFAASIQVGFQVFKRVYEDNVVALNKRCGMKQEV